MDFVVQCFATVSAVTLHARTLMNTYTIIRDEWKDALSSSSDEDWFLKYTLETFSNWCYSDNCTDWSDTLASPYKPRSQKTKQKEAVVSVMNRGGNADWILQTNTHLQWGLHSHKPVKCLSCSQKTVFSSSITARPYLIHFKQWCLLWWISNVRELENYYLDLAVFFGWPIVPQFLLGALAPAFHLHKLHPFLHVSLVMSEIDFLLAKFMHLTPYKERGPRTICTVCGLPHRLLYITMKSDH